MKILIVLVFICIATNTHVSADTEVVKEDHDVTTTNSSHTSTDGEVVKEEHDVTPTNSSHTSADRGVVKEEHDVTLANSSHASAHTEVVKEEHDDVTPTNSSHVAADTEVAVKKEHDVTSNNSSERVPMRPIFPKSVQEFIITTKSAIDNDTTPVHRPKKPVFKIVQKAVKMKNKNYWKTATKRPSLMKHVKFTVDPLTSNRYSKRSHKHTGKDDVERKHDAEFRKMMKGKEDDSSEESSEADDKRKDKRKNVKTLVQRFHKLGSKISRKKTEDTKEGITLNSHNHNNTTEPKPREGEFSSEEKEDKKEFIFVNPQKIQELNNKRVSEDSDESGEATTIIVEKESKSQQKRSINVIEEENLGTTISGFKFTGKISSLSSNLVFRNINT